MRLAPQEVRTFHVTFVTAERRRIFQSEPNIRSFLQVLSHHRDLKRFSLHAFVVMPNHVHLLITPAEEISLEKAVQYIKGSFSFRMQDRASVWQRGFNEARIRNGAQFVSAKQYIELNPVRAHFVEDPKLFPWSSAGSGYEVDPIPAHFASSLQEEARG